MDHPSFPATTTTPLEYSLFSPSKAAEQQRLAKDWTYIHSFLRKKYPAPSRVPKFEENEETLIALLALAAANEKADEGWSGVCGVEEMALRELEEEESRKVSFRISESGGDEMEWLMRCRNKTQTTSTPPSLTTSNPPSQNPGPPTSSPTPPHPYL